MASLIRLDQRVPFVMKWEKELQEKDPSYLPTTFYFRPPTPAEHSRYKDLVEARLYGAASVYLTETCLTGHDNLFDQGKPKKFDETAGVTGWAFEWICEAAVFVDRLGDPPSEVFPRSASPSG